MGEVVTVGLDIAKSVFQVHAVDAEGVVVVQRKLTRAKLIPFFEKLSPCLIGIEACATAHQPPDRARPFGEADAAVVCEALSEAAEERRS